MKSHPYPTRYAVAAGLVALGLVVAQNASAAYTVTISQVGTDVVASGTGSLDFAGPVPTTSQSAGQIQANMALIGVGPIALAPTNRFVETGATGPSSFGPGGYIAPASGTGDVVTLWDNGGAYVAIQVPADYHLGNPLSGSTTWNNHTIADMGLTPGTYEWSWELLEGHLDSFTLIINAPAAAATSVPTLGEWGAIGLAGLVGLFGLSRMRQQTRA